MWLDLLRKGPTSTKYIQAEYHMKTRRRVQDCLISGSLSADPCSKTSHQPEARLFETLPMYVKLVAAYDKAVFATPEARYHTQNCDGRRCMFLLIKVGENELHHCAAAHAAVADGRRVSTSIQLAGPLIQERFAAGKLAGNQKRQEDRRVAICTGED
jgi:hypothetical protein